MSSTMAETEKTKNVIEKSIFNRHETKKTNTFIENQFSISLMSKKQKLSLKKSKGLRPKKQRLSLKNQFSIALKLKKQKLSLKKQFGS